MGVLTTKGDKFNFGLGEFLLIGVKWPIMVDAQKWLDENYPKEKRSEVREIYIDKQLENDLALKDFVYKDYLGDGLKVYISCSLDVSKIEIKIKGKWVKTIKLVNNI